ncbi:MAG: hypothetical protein ACUVXI_15880, partial [bacterium]
QVAQTIDDAYVKSRALADVASKYVEVGQRDRASEILPQALQVAQTIDDAYVKSRALAEVAGRYMEIGRKVGDRTKKILHGIIKGLG